MPNMNVSMTLRLVDQWTAGMRAANTVLQQFARTTADLNRSTSSTGLTSQFSRLGGQIRGMTSDMRALVGQFAQLNSQMGRSGGGSFAQRQVADLRQVLQLQQQVIANQGRMVAGPAGGGGLRPPGGGGGGMLGRSGFSPNASIQDRLQYRGVNLGERSLLEGYTQADLASTRLRALDLAPEVLARLNEEANKLSAQWRELTTSDIREMFGEVVTNFATPDQAFRMLPYLAAVQARDVQAGRNAGASRGNMLELMRAVGLTGKLTDNQGNLTETQAADVIDVFMRAQMVGGRDVNTSQFFQLIKYLKSSAQSLNKEALLMAAIGMPDLRGSSFGNQLAMLSRGFADGTTTKVALEAQARAGLRAARIDPNHPEGPNKLRVGELVDAELFRADPFKWFETHILGPEGYLSRSRERGGAGLNLTDSRVGAPQIAQALGPLVGNASAQNMANQIANMIGEWRTQARIALALNEGRKMWERGGPLDRAADQSGWTAMQRARAQFTDALAGVARNFDAILLPVLNNLTSGLQSFQRLTNPETGSPLLGLGLVGGAGLAGFLALRRMMIGMGGTGRMLFGAGAGLLVGGGLTDALVGGLMARSFGGGTVAAAAGAAGAAAGTAWGSRFLAALRRLPMGILRFTLWGALATGITAIVDNWEAVKTRLLQIWADLKAALPSFLGGGDQGMSALTQGRGLSQLGEDIRQGARSATGAVRDLFDPPEHQSIAPAQNQALVQQLEQIARASAAGKGTTQPINVNVTVNVNQTNASPQQIGEAAGNAVGSKLQQYMAETPMYP